MQLFDDDDARRSLYPKATVSYRYNWSIGSLECLLGFSIYVSYFVIMSLLFLLLLVPLFLLTIQGG